MPYLFRVLNRSATIAAQETHIRCCLPSSRVQRYRRKIVEEVEQELQELKGLKKRVTRVKNTAPKAGGGWCFVVHRAV